MNLLRLLSHHLFASFATQLVISYVWLSSGWEKVYGGQFVPNIGKTLGRFASSNPHEWYVSSVLEVAKSYPVVFGMLVQWGELLVGIGLAAALILYGFSKRRSFKRSARFVASVALLGGIFMNANFYFGSGWTSPSAEGLNALMFWIQVSLVVVWFFRCRP